MNAKRTCRFLMADGRVCENDAADGQMRCDQHGADIDPRVGKSIRRRSRAATGGTPTNSLYERLSPLQRQLVDSYGVGEATVAAYPRHLDPLGLGELVQAGVSPAEAQRWPDRFIFGSEIVALLEADLEPEQAAMWPQRFSGGDIAELHAAGMTAKTSGDWDERFSGFDITYLLSRDIGADEANPYPGWLTCRQLALLVERGISPEVAAAIDPEDALTYDELRGVLDLM